MFRIYGLHASDAVIRYVGVTAKALSARMTGHRIDAKERETRKARWMRKAVRAGDKIRIVLLATVPTQAEAYQLERAYIETYLALGVDLVNATAGGEGITGASEETRSKMRAAWARMTPEARAERGARIAAAHRGKKASADARRAMRQAHTGKSRAPESTEKQRAKVTGRKKPTGFDAGWSKLTPEQREQRLAGLKATRHRPHTEAEIAKMRASKTGTKASEETKARISQSQRERWERRRARVHEGSAGQDAGATDTMRLSRR